MCDMARIMTMAQVLLIRSYGFYLGHFHLVNTKKPFALAHNVKKKTLWPKCTKTPPKCSKKTPHGGFSGTFRGFAESFLVHFGFFWYFLGVVEGGGYFWYFFWYLTRRFFGTFWGGLVYFGCFFGTFRSFFGTFWRVFRYISRGGGSWHN